MAGKQDVESAMKFGSTVSYVASEDLTIAVNAAVTLQRPLLVKGEPGTGKTELAELPVDFWVEALESSLVWSLPWSAWQRACAAWPAWCALERATLVRLLEEKMQREQRLLQETATQRYLGLQAERPEWAQRVPLKQLASYLGVTDVALSRIRRRLNPG